MTENMGITPEAVAWAESVGAMRRAVLELTPEQREHGARLLSRADALGTALLVVREAEMRDEELRAHTLAVLAQMRDGARAEFHRYREAVGVPGVVV